MNRYFWISLACLISISVSNTFAQKQKKTKEEIALEKEWAAKLKQVKPME